MLNQKLKSGLLGATLVGGLAFGAASCAKDKEQQDSEKTKTEVEIRKTPEDIKAANTALFEECQNDIKFALAFVENYYPYIYWDGKAWTTGHGLTILYDANGGSVDVICKTPVPTLAESDIYKNRYLTIEVLKDVQDCFLVPVDRDVLVSACVLRYCIGSGAFKQSNFLKYVNAGKSKTELAKALTGYRTPQGILKRCYFFAAILAGKMQYSDLLDLRAEGCYNLEVYEVVKCCKDTNGNYKRIKDKDGNLIYVVEADKDGFATWIFDDLDTKLKRAKNSRKTNLHLDKNKNGKTVNVECQLTKDIVPDYVWQDVSNRSSSASIKTTTKEINWNDLTADNLNDTSKIAYNNGGYEKALKAGEAALDLAKTNKQLGAAYFNIGEAHMAMKKYGRAKDNYEKSLIYNKTNIAAKQLEIAKQKQHEKRHNTGGKVLLGFAAGIALVHSINKTRKYYLMQQKKMQR